jgi:hypothetical protein
MAKEVVLVDPLALGEATNGGGTQAEEAALRKIDATEMEVVSVSSDEPPNPRAGGMRSPSMGQPVPHLVRSESTGGAAGFRARQRRGAGRLGVASGRVQDLQQCPVFSVARPTKCHPPDCQVR